jgi:hypothetical protein
MLPSTVMHHAVHKTLKAAYSFYNVSKHTPVVDLMQDALIVAKNVRTTFSRDYTSSLNVEIVRIKKS